MKKTRRYLALCTLFVMLFAACGTTPTDTTPTDTPVATETPAATATIAPTEAPAATATPVPTEAPAATATPVPTEAPAATATPIPTEAPAATATPVPTEAPAATATPVPTEAPVATATPVPTATPAPTATPKPTATPAPTKAPAADLNKTYNFDDLTYRGSYGTKYEVQLDGSINLQFEGQYQEIMLNLPDELDMSYCHKVTVKAISSFAPLSVKIYDANGTQIFVEYNCKSDTVTDFVLSPDITEKAAGIGLMALDKVADTDYIKYKATVYSITFHMDSNYVPGATPAPLPVVPETEDGATLLNTYGSLFGNMGTCINLNQLQNKRTLEILKAQYNSVTSENEMKPDAMLGGNPTLISVDEAKALGYVIPSNYKESTVPKINFNSVDATLKICSKNGLGYRAHTLVWHSQTPEWFFHTGYSASASYVSKEVMDARLEFYIRTVMTHVYDSPYGDCVYAWDVVNEYLHSKAIPNYTKIYGDPNTTSSYVKLAYEVADDVLRSYGIRDKVSLILNDFNTYGDGPGSQITQNLVSLVKFMNSEKKICDGIGMQSHLGTGYPTIDMVKKTAKTFLDAGLEVQITELDVAGSNAAVQADYYYNLMRALLDLAKDGKKISGLTYWGMSDSTSWIKQNNPLLFTTPTEPKDAYFRVLQAYRDAGYKVSK